MRPITSVLIANRGEIACRIIRTCKRLNIRTIAVYSDADKDAPHVKMADAAAALGGSESKDTYLNIEKLVAVARAAKVDAVHPGYGFLSENPLFPAALAKTGIRFIGPSAETMRALGDKIRAKTLAAKCRVPTVPALVLENFEQNKKATGEKLKAFAAEVGFPLIVKAAAGGGGRGMRRIDSLSEASRALESAAREAKASFGDGRIFIEKLVEHPRHIEVQLFGDATGAVIHLWDRDCTMQRRHQKVIEEAPAFAIAPKTRAAILKAAVTLARAAKYKNAGTAEFLLDRAGKFYFLEVNSRLQVEHPVTEQHAKLDLVELQIRIAEDRPLKALVPVRLKEQRNVSIEARVCAENPKREFAPATGRIELLRLPNDANIRVECGISEGGTVTYYYDPLVAKIIATAKTRAKAASALAAALDNTSIIGVTTNLAFLTTLLRSKEFRTGSHTTATAEAYAQRESKREIPYALIAALVVAGRSLSRSSSNDPWETLRSFRVFGTGWRCDAILIDSMEISVETKYIASDSISCTVKSSLGEQQIDLRGAKSKDDLFTVQHGKTALTFFYTAAGHSEWIQFQGGTYAIRARESGAARVTSTQSAGILRSPLPGKVIDIRVRAGQTVSAGAPIIVLESMKMEHTLTAPFNGSITAISTKKNTIVDAGEALATIKPLK